MCIRDRVHNPEILILDEPTAGVDVELRANLWANINKLNNEGKTIIITTHYLHEAEELCNEIAIIDDGNLITKNTTSNIKSLIDRKQIIISLDDERKSIKTKLDNLLSESNKIAKEIGIKIKSGNNYIKDLKEKGCENLIILPLYPQYASPTTATVCDEVFRSLMKLRWQPSIQIVSHYEENPLYIDAIINSIKKNTVVKII